MSSKQETAQIRCGNRTNCRRFLRRYRDPSLQKPENTSVAHAADLSKVSVGLLGKALDEHAFFPEMIYNCNERGEQNKWGR